MGFKRTSGGFCWVWCAGTIGPTQDPCWYFQWWPMGPMWATWGDVDRSDPRMIGHLEFHGHPSAASEFPQTCSPPDWDPGASFIITRQWPAVFTYGTKLSHQPSQTLFNSLEFDFYSIQVEICTHIKVWLRAESNPRPRPRLPMQFNSIKRKYS